MDGKGQIDGFKDSCFGSDSISGHSPCQDPLCVKSKIRLSMS